MIPQFEGPILTKTPHARQLYQVVKSDNLLTWPKIHLELIDFVSQHPRLELANDTFILTFFDNHEEDLWMGREVIGHDSQLPAPWKTYDSFAGDVFRWEWHRTEKEFPWTHIRACASRLKNLAGEALAPTWRCLISLNNSEKSELISHLSFQFFKNY